MLIYIGMYNFNFIIIIYALVGILFTELIAYGSSVHCVYLFLSCRPTSYPNYHYSIAQAGYYIVTLKGIVGALLPELQRSLNRSILSNLVIHPHIILLPDYLDSLRLYANRS